MKKLLQLSAASLLVSAISLPLHADTAAQDATIASKPSTSSPANKDIPREGNLRFTLRHSFPLPIETIAIPWKKIQENPLALLKVIKENLAKHTEKREKPVQIDTKLDLLLPAEATKVVGKLPTLSIKSNIDKKGAAKSDLALPAFRRDGLIDWKGLTAQLSFAENLNTVGLNLAGLSLKDEKFSVTLGKTKFNGQFDANQMPIQMDLSLPTLQVRHKTELLNLRDFYSQFSNDQSSKDPKLGEFKLKVGHLDVSQDKSKYSFDGLAVTASSEKAPGGVINYSLRTKADSMTFGGVSGVSFVENLVLRNLDKEAFEELLQIILEENPREIDDPKATVITVLGKFTEVLPKFLAKSPELALTELKVKTPNGNIQGNASVSINGKKATPSATLGRSALEAQAAFDISKGLFERALTSITLATMLNLSEKQLSKENLAFLKQQAEAASKQQISMLVKLKWLVDTGDGNYKVVAAFKDNKLKLNGVEVPLPF